MKNVIFSVYRYHLTPCPTEVRMTWEDGLLRPQQFATLEAYFEALLPAKGQQLPVWDKARTAKANLAGKDVGDDGSNARDMKDYHRADIVEHKEGIVVLTIQANGSKRYIDRENQPHRMSHYPSSCVLIDNRPGHQLMAIEQCHRDAAMEPERVVRLLLSHFNAVMPQVGVQLEIVELVRCPEFFEAVQQILVNLDDQVRKLEFNFPSDSSTLRVRNYDQSLDPVLALQDWLSGFAYRGHLAAMIRNNRAFMSEKVQKTWGLVAQLCAQGTGYYLRVRFERFGWFQYGQETNAQFGIEKEAIDRFAGIELKVHEADLFIDDDELPVVKKQSLRVWLEDIAQLAEDYEERKVSKRKAKRRYRRAV